MRPPMATKLLKQQLREVISKLADPPSSKDALVELLEDVLNCLSKFEQSPLGQSPLPSVVDLMKQCVDAIAQKELLKHQDKDVEVLVANCFCEITRITVPEAPFEVDVLRDMFRLVVGTISCLGEMNSASFGRSVVILDMLSRYRPCLLMLDNEFDDLVEEMFSVIFSVSSDAHPENVLLSMQKVMVLILDESEEISETLLCTILSPLGRKKTNFSRASRKLAMDVIEHCAAKLESSVQQFLVSSLLGDYSTLNDSIDYREVIYDIYQCAPQILSGIVPHITGILLADSSDARLGVVQLVGELFSLPGIPIHESFRPLFAELLKRITDRTVEVRLCVIEQLKNSLISNAAHIDLPAVTKALSDRLLDYDENVRKQVVYAISDVACNTVDVMPAETAKLLAERLRDKSQSVKRYAMERLADLYRNSCLKSADVSRSVDEHGWIVGKILRCLYDKDFRSESIELILCGSLFPLEFSIKDRLKHWTAAISGFDKVEVKALEQVLLQKQRLQLEMQNYLSLRQKPQEDVAELQKKVSSSFRNMSRLFSDAAKAEEGFQILHQLKDVNIWNMLTALIDPSITFQEAWSSRDNLLKTLGEKHNLYEFMSMLSMKCSYLLFNKEYVKEILLEACASKTSDNVKFISSCMNLLAIIACFSPLLLVGFEENLVQLLKEDNEIAKEGAAHVLAKAGGGLREQLAKTSSSVDLLLERLCLEGTRKQAKYSVQALAAITQDDGLKSLSVLYKRLVDLLEKKTHLPAILQSLGCIAQSAMPIYETREDEIFGFIKQNVLENSNPDKSLAKCTKWNEKSEICLLKIFGIKTLVKSYLPASDAHLRPGIEKVVDILKNILTFGDISKDIESSEVDKAHMRLSAAKAVLRLSRQWDHKIPIDVFYMTLRVSEDTYAQSRKIFFNKVNQYLKERHLDAKYACAFLLNINRHHSPEYNEGKQNLLEVFQVYQQAKMRQLSSSADGNSTNYPEYILAYLVHALAHHPSCPKIDECKDFKAFEPIYWRLHLFLSMLLHGDEAGQYEGGPDRREICTYLVSIFHSIKCSEDVADRTKSKASHAICELGLCIMKKLFPDHADISGTAPQIALPTTLYKSVQNEGEQSVENGEHDWLGGESIVAHFEALNPKNEESIVIAAKGETVVQEKNGDGNDVPLGKMVKTLKLHGSKKKKTVTKCNTSTDKNNPESEDVLGVVREINLDNLKEDQSLETGNASKDQHSVDDELSPSQLTKVDTTSILSLDPLPTPKRKRSAPTQRSRSDKANGQKQGKDLGDSHSTKKEENAEGRKLTKGIKESTNSGFLVSCLPTIKSMSSWGDKKVSNGSKSGGTTSRGQKESPNQVGPSKKIGSTKSSSDSSRKRKIRSISGLAESSSRSSQSGDEELVGSRVKVWWPLDKTFYEGTIRSYDPEAKKHEILYDDGDTERLRLDKEKWELITESDTPKKRQKSSSKKQLSSRKKSKKNKRGNSRDDKNTSKKARKTASKRRKSSDNGINMDESNSEAREDSDASDSEPHSGAEADDVKADKEGKKDTAADLETKEEAGAEEIKTGKEPSEETKPNPPEGSKEDDQKEDDRS